MTSEALYKELNYVNHSRENRMKYAQMLIKDQSLIPQILDILFTVDDKISCRAAWVLEFMCNENLEAIIPYLDRFTAQMKTVHLDSAVRPVAKICEYLVTANYGKQESEIRKALTNSHKELMIEVCFDYMINDEKIAPKAYAMNSLYLLGTEYNWIHPELITILERDYANQSAGYKARARKIITKINKAKSKS
ncbi:MAG: adenylosuccinate lyase [Bacteroidetes bacterium MedPE-SWsnd-G2]|nr:MAG: adenylosuccinate lyase [Bacteroidetes bacterium MedPE-SWsnd-G2]